MSAPDKLRRAPELARYLAWRTFVALAILYCIAYYPFAPLTSVYMRY